MAKDLLQKFRSVADGFSWGGEMHWYPGHWDGQGHRTEDIIVWWPAVPGWKFAKRSHFEILFEPTHEEIYTLISEEDTRLKAEGFDPIQGCYVGNPPKESK
jgi:hypothetical protein